MTKGGGSVQHRQAAALRAIDFEFPTTKANGRGCLAEAG